jgi:hypothetical protein
LHSVFAADLDGDGVPDVLAIQGLTEGSTPEDDSLPPKVTVLLLLNVCGVWKPAAAYAEPNCD